MTAEIFGCDRSGEGLPSYEYAVTAAAPGVFRTDVGLPIVVEAGLDRLSAADLGIVVCWDQTDVLPPPSVLEALRAITKRGGRVLVPLIVNEAEDPANLAGVQQWTLRHLGEPISVDDLAARAVMSPRNLARQFAARTGTTPQAYRRTFSQTR